MAGWLGRTFHALFPPTETHPGRPSVLSRLTSLESEMRQQRKVTAELQAKLAERLVPRPATPAPKPARFVPPAEPWASEVDWDAVMRSDAMVERIAREG